MMSWQTKLVRLFLCLLGYKFRIQISQCVVALTKKPSHAFGNIFLPLATQYKDFCKFPKTIGSYAQLSNIDVKIILKNSLPNVLKFWKQKLNQVNGMESLVLGQELNGGYRLYISKKMKSWLWEVCLIHWKKARGNHL